MKSGDQLFTRKVTLTDFIELNTSSILGDGFGRLYASANGVRNADSVASAANLPQVRIYNQYAAMFEYYQIDKFTARFIPYKWEMTSSNVGTSPANARPTYSIIDPEADNPTTASGFLSYGNCLVTVPYKENSRTVDY